MVGNFQYLSPSNESLIEKKKTKKKNKREREREKRAQINDKSHGPIKSKEAPIKERAKGKFN